MALALMLALALALAPMLALALVLMLALESAEYSRKGMYALNTARVHTLRDQSAQLA